MIHGTTMLDGLDRPEPQIEARAGERAAEPRRVRLPAATIREYIAIARLDHMTKQVFILPGIVFAWMLREPSLSHAIVAVPLGFLSAVLIASANYVINEWLDREFDAFHPEKSNRTALQWRLSPALVYTEYAVLAAAGLILAQLLGAFFFWASVAFVLSGLIYNVKPIRTKDRPFLDVVSESVNNPIRLTLGWTMIDPGTLPPASILIAYWAGGAFLMGAKRLSEYRDITSLVGVEMLCRYRRSFAAYTAESLMASCFLYAMISAFFLAVFFIRYRLEYILALPFIAILFTAYFWLSLLRNSVAQRPERSFHSRRLVAAVTATVAALLVMTFVDVPVLKSLSAPSFLPKQDGR